MTNARPESLEKPISVIVPTRNRRALLERLLAQLLRSEFEHAYEVIVVDEASTDSTPGLLEDLSAAGRIRVVRNDPPLGAGGARNSGLSVAGGRYVAWIDDDDLTSPDRLVRQRDALEAKNLRWSCSATVDIDDDLNIIGHRRCPPAEGLFRQLLRFNCLPATGQGLLVERALAQEVGGFDTSLERAQDWDFCIRLAAVGEPHLLDEPLVGYRTGFESFSTDTDLVERCIARIYEKHKHLMEEHGAEPDWASVHRSLLTAELLMSRRRALWRIFRLLRAEPSLRNVARCGAIMLVPRRFATQSADRRRNQVPEAWKREARRWLDDVNPSVGEAGSD